ncbi:MAG: hypothetical protein IPO92_18175 [Saprospiraceae bacterium]|nr:hypothetical protein [Saprospiraceae bacterium]
MGIIPDAVLVNFTVLQSLLENPKPTVPIVEAQKLMVSGAGGLIGSQTS